MTAGAVDAANVPSLSQAQVTSLFTQEGQSWSALTGATIPGGLANDVVYVARRVNGSGTQKTYEAVIARTLNNNLAGKSCYGNLPSFVTGPEAADNAAASTLCTGLNLVVNNSGSGQVAACLNTLNTAGKGAIGTLTTEQVSTTGWKHVRINGLAGSYANVKSGAYTAYGDAALNTRVLPAIGADHAAYKTAFKNLFAIVPLLQPSFGDVTTDAGKAGVLALNTVTGLTTGNPWTRTDDSGVIDNCRPARSPG